MRVLSGRKVAVWVVLIFGGGFLVGMGARAGDDMEKAGGGRGGPGIEVVAEVDGQPVTRAELEERAAAALRQLDQQRHQVLETTLSQMVEERLVAAEASEQGLSAEAYLTAEIEARTTPVTDEEVDAWYQANQARVRQPKEQVAEQIRAFLQRQRRQQAREELLAGIRAGHQVAVHLEPMRLEVPVAGAPTQGPEGAPVTVVAFSDFQCPYCQRLNPALDRLREAYGERLRVAFRQFPLTSIHNHAQQAAEASLCARDQGRFWPMHDALFAHQRELTVEKIKELAGDLGLDRARFDACLDAGERRPQVQADLEAGQAAGVSGTPALFVNGRPVTLVSGRDPFDQLAAVVEDELSRQGIAAR